MAIPGVTFELTERDKELAVKYVEEGGLFKNRLADFLGISRPTLDKYLDEHLDFFTALKRADSIFCKTLIENVKKKDPMFILKTRYKDEFTEQKKTIFDPEPEIQRVKKMLEAYTSKEIHHAT